MVKLNEWCGSTLQLTIAHSFAVRKATITSLHLCASQAVLCCAVPTAHALCNSKAGTQVQLVGRTSVHEDVMVSKPNLEVDSIYLTTSEEVQEQALGHLELRVAVKTVAPTNTKHGCMATSESVCRC